MSETTPINVNELAQIAAIGGQLGIPIGNIVEFTEVMAAMGVSTNLSTTEAATGMARFANIMGTSYNDFDRIGSVIVDLGNNFATTESEILTFATRLAPIGATIGATEEEVLGLAAAFSQMGVPAERGATAIQRVFIDIEEAVALGGEELEKFAEVAGMTMDEFTNARAVDRFEAFINGLARIEDEGGSAIITLKELGINQQRTISVLLAAAANADGFADALERANEAGEESTALFDEAAKRYGTTASQIQLMANSFNALRIELGGSFIDGVIFLADALRDLFAGMRDNLDTVKTFMAIFAALGVVKVVLGLVSAFQALGVAITTMTAAATGAGVLTAITAALPALAATAAIALGVMAIQWGANAKKARELKEQVVEFVDILTDPNLSDDQIGESIGELLERSNNVDLTNLRNELNTYGISLTEFFEKGRVGGEEFDEMMQDIFDVELEGIGEGFTFADLDNATIIKEFGDVGRAYIGLMAIFETSQTEYIARERDANLAAKGFAEDAMDTAWNLMQATRGLGKSPTELFWDRLADEEAANAFNKYADSVGVGMDDMVEAIQDGYADIRQEVFDSIDMWNDAWEAADVDWTAQISSWSDQMSVKEALVAYFRGEGADLPQGVKDVINGWSLEYQASFLEAFEGDPALYDEIISGIETNLVDRVNDVTDDMFEDSGITEAEMYTMIMESMAGAKKAGEDGSFASTEAFKAGLDTHLDKLSGEAHGKFVDILGIIFGDGGVPGMDLTEADIAGLIEWLNAIPTDITTNVRVVVHNPGTDIWDWSDNTDIWDYKERARGGPVTRGQPYIIGETGPEVFIPNQSGTILPNKSLGSSGDRTVNVNIIRPETNDLAGDISEGLTRASITEQVDMIGAY